MWFEITDPKYLADGPFLQHNGLKQEMLALCFCFWYVFKRKPYISGQIFFSCKYVGRFSFSFFATNMFHTIKGDIY